MYLFPYYIDKINKSLTKDEATSVLYSSKSDTDVDDDGYKAITTAWRYWKPPINQNLMNTQENNTSNIPATGFLAEDTNGVHETKTVVFNTVAKFSFSQFSLIQLLHGQATNTIALAPYNFKETADLLNKIAIFSLTNPNFAKVELQRNEVQLLRKWLEARMAHCEMERDSRKLSAGTCAKGMSVEEHVLTHQKFNPDTYIAQKFLLLDLREWLAGDIID